MALIRIQESSEQEGVFWVKVSFNQGTKYEVTVRDPFSEEEEKHLEWYFEEHLKFPFTNQVKAQEAATSLTAYGESLFAQVFATSSQVLSAYNIITQERLDTLQIEIVGQPPFHALHWEALKDPNLPQPLALQATIVRKSGVYRAIPATLRSSPTINLLIVVARPQGGQDVGYRTISRPLVESLRHDKLPVKIDVLRPGTYKALEQQLHTTTAQYGVGYYHVIHFDVHGSLIPYSSILPWIRDQRYGRDELRPYEGMKAFLSLEREKDKYADLLEATELAKLLQVHQIPIAILNACQSGKQIGTRETSLGSRLIQEGVQLVLAMGYSVTVSAAELLMRALYTQLFAGSDLSVAIRKARTELYYNKERRAYFDQRIDLEDWLLPVVFQNQPVQFKSGDFTPEDRSVYNKHEKQYDSPEPQYGFVGRDLDILQIERSLLAKHNLLLIRGMAGAGKTTLLKHLQAWWHTTGFVQQTFYFGYDERAWTHQQILTEIAQQLYDAKYYTDIQPFPFDEQQRRLTERLRAEPHLLILDNLESSTDVSLAMPHTLSEAEQDALHSFLADLANGCTLVLLGSRGGEGWLARDTFDDNIYDLPGLDDEAASTLADRILERNHATKYRQDEKEKENLRKLLKVLDGFPLAMEVVLANLRQQTPREVLEELQAGDVRLDAPTSQQQGKDIFEQKTESILRCIGYSYNNLSPDAQQLLQCLAPFTGVIWQSMLDKYTSQLAQQPTLRHLLFEHWPEVIQEAQNWGLLTSDKVSGFLRLHPIFPYFLRNSLNKVEYNERYVDIEKAFREYYKQLGDELFRLLQSENSRERQMSQLFIGLEYENLVAALHLTLVAQESIGGLCKVLREYLNCTHQPHLELALFLEIKKQFTIYPLDGLNGQFGRELVGTLGTIANRQYELKQFAEAKQSYHFILELVGQISGVNEQMKGTWKATGYYQLGMVAGAQHEFQQAEQYYQQALQILIEINDRHNQANVYHSLGTVAQKENKVQQAERYYQDALQLYIEFNDRHGQANIYQNLANMAVEQRQFRQAEQYYQQALQIKQNDPYEQADIYYNLGMVAQEQHEFQQAEQYYLDALTIFRDFNDHDHLSIILHSLARLLQDSGDTAIPARIAVLLGMTREEIGELLTTLEQALPILKDGDHTREVATLNNMAGVYADAGKPEEALMLYQQALSIQREIEDRRGETFTLKNIATVYRETGKPEEALLHYEQALPILRAVRDPVREATTLNNMASMYSEIGKPEEAISHYEQALSVLRGAARDRVKEAITLTNMSLVYYEIGKPEEAIRLLEQALSIQKEDGDQAEEAATLNNMAQIYYKIGKLEEAIRLLEQESSLLQSANIPQDATGYTVAMLQQMVTALQKKNQD